MKRNKFPSYPLQDNNDFETRSNRQGAHRIRKSRKLRGASGFFSKRRFVRLGLYAIAFVLLVLGISTVLAQFLPQSFLTPAAAFIRNAAEDAAEIESPAARATLSVPEKNDEVIQLDNVLLARSQAFPVDPASSPAAPGDNVKIGEDSPRDKIVQPDITVIYPTPAPIESRTMPTLSQETLPKPTTTPSIIKPAASEHTDQLQEPPAPTVTTVRPIVPTTTPTQSPEQLTPEPSEDPSETPRFRPVGKQAYVCVDNGYLRLHGNLEAEIIGHVGAGDAIWEIETDGTWSLVELPSGLRAYIHASLFQYEPLDTGSFSPEPPPEPPLPSEPVLNDDEPELMDEPELTDEPEQPEQSVPEPPQEIIVDRDAWVGVNLANVRSEASLDGEIIDQLPFGTKVVQYSLIGDWSRIQTDQIEGYVFSYLLRPDDPNATPPVEEEPEPTDGQELSEEPEQTDPTEEEPEATDEPEEEHEEPFEGTTESIEQTDPTEEEPETADEPEEEEEYEEPVPSASSDGQRAVDIAISFAGGAYVYGGSHPSHGGFDCSGLVYYAYTQLGYTIGRGAQDQSWYGITIDHSGIASGDMSNLMPGDLLFWAHDPDPGISHVGMYVGGGEFIHASSTATGIRYSSLYSAYYADCVLVKRIAY